ncbi:DUF4240 domain-containing protein [Bacillus sp. FJAT-42376]|uniref:DUF4240 domain-containing protein n=1 Tax=Bacillus sp. FJAT-42376 TaxID=2014076 RepID=UPI000F4F8094|nr:DUF4240 domain-containing protein [Bacillus sp. FJAT-42376]AZB42719.1 DUF4240 domain-containing protein [Bacillus sp. FJAT-42376]
MEILLYVQEGSLNKFWKISVTGRVYIVTFGKAGTTGTVRSKQFESAAVCLKEAEKLIQSKLKKGYRPGTSKMQIMKKSEMTEEAFWSIFEQAKRYSSEQEEQLEWMVEHLAGQTIQDIVKFDELFSLYFIRSYTSNLWAAAYVIMGGCSDDCFDYFRAWLLFQGKKTYEAAIQNPETMIPPLMELEAKNAIPQFEDLTYIGALAYEEKTGLNDSSYYEFYDQMVIESYVEADIELDWDEEDEEGFKNRFPKLWERFGENPLEC